MALRSNWLRELERLGAPVSPALRAYLSIVGHTNPSLSQAGFRAYNDDGGEATATAKAAENTNWTQNVDETFQWRVVVDETAGGTENNVRWRVQYNHNGLGWNDVTALSSVVRAVDSANLTDDEATTRRLTSGTGTFLTGRVSEDGLTNTVVSFAGGELTELLYALQIIGTDVADLDTIQLRVVREAGTVLESYAQTPTITVSETTAITGDLNKALPLSLSAAGAVLVESDLSKTLPLALASSAAVLVEADLAKSLPLSLSAAGTVGDPSVTGDLAEALPLSLSAAGAVLVQGEFAEALALDLVASGVVAVEGTFAESLPLDLAAAGDVAIAGTFSRALPLALTADDSGGGGSPSSYGWFRRLRDLRPMRTLRR